MPETIINVNESEEQEKSLTLVRLSNEDSESDFDNMKKWPSGILLGD